MTDAQSPLSERQLEQLHTVIDEGAQQASSALTTWIGRPSLIRVESLDQLPLNEATAVLGEGEDPVCFCAMAVTGWLSGQLILAFDDASGLALANLILQASVSDSTDDVWGEIEQSAAMETANILGCAFLNALAAHAGEFIETDAELIPSPPCFNRDFAESLLQFALMGQAAEHSTVFLTRTRFEVSETPLNWTLLFVPDGASLDTLHRVLPGAEEGSS